MTNPGDRVYAVAGGNYVTIRVDARDTGGAFDLIDVLAPPGGGPPPHRHAFAEWFHILEGSLELLTVDDGRLSSLAVLGAGESQILEPWLPHTTRNPGPSPVRFLVAGWPGVMTDYFSQAGVAVADTDTLPPSPPPGPTGLAAIAAQHQIEFVAAS